MARHPRVIGDPVSGFHPPFSAFRRPPLEPSVRPPQTGPITTFHPTMALLETLGTNLPMALLFLGVLLFSVATAVVALLADY